MMVMMMRRRRNRSRKIKKEAKSDKKSRLVARVGSSEAVDYLKTTDQSVGLLVGRPSCYSGPSASIK